MRPLLRWLHLSDLHHGLPDGGTDKHDRLDTFFADVGALVERLGPVDLVLFTGDLTQSGTKDQFDGLDAAVIGPLRALLGDVPVLAVPGNHDLQWDTSFGGVAMTKALCGDAEARNHLFREERERLKFVRARFAEYTKWWKRTRPAGVREGLLPGDFLYTFERAGLRIGIAGLNTAGLHLHGEVEEGQLFVDAAQLRKACGGGAEIGAWLKGHGFNLLLTHHPSTWLQPGNRAEAFDGGLLAPRFDLHLFGHMHVPLTTEQMNGGGTPRRGTQAASLFGLDKFRVVEGGVEKERKERRFGYALVELCENDGDLVTRAFPRRAERCQDDLWRYGSDRSYLLEEDYLPVVPMRFERKAPAAASAPVAPAARACHLDATGWAASVSDHSAWKPGSEDWKSRAVAIVEVCAEAWTTSATAIGEDPWRDADMPVRVIDRLGEMVGPLRPAQVAMLLAAPFVYEAVRASALAWVAEAGIEDFGQRLDAPPPRPALEEVHRANAREVRLTQRADAHGEGRKRAIALWMAHRTVDRVPEVWDPSTIPAMKPLHAKLAALLENTPLGLLRDLARCLAPGLGRLEGEGGLLRDERRQDGEEAEGGRLGTLLVAAGALALDPRRLDSLVVDHVGTDEEFDVRTLPDRLAGTRWSAVKPDRGDVRVAALECSDAVTHYLVVDLVQQARTVLAALYRDGRDALPGGVSEAGVRPVQEGGADKFVPVHVRFRLDHVRVRELLMGQQLYKDPTLAIRELYQNALDACRYRRVRTAFLKAKNPYDNREYAGSIVLRQGRRPDGRMVIECQDDGVGMDKLMLERVFAVAGQRFHDQPGYLEEKANWEAWRRANPGNPRGDVLQLWPNSQHGIGVLSYFMLADELEILTRAFRADGEPGDAIRVEISSASGLFRVSPGPRDLEVGTRVRLVLERETYEAEHEGEKDVSVVDILGRLLVVAEVPVVVSEGGKTESWGQSFRLGDGEHGEEWEPNVPRVPNRAGWSWVPVQPPYAWWTDSEQTPVLVDGLVTNDTRAMVLVNLTGPRLAKRISADRASVLEADFSWLTPALGAALAGATALPGLDQSFLEGLFGWVPEAVAVGWERLLAADPVLILANVRRYHRYVAWGPDRGNAIPRARLSRVGVFADDTEMVAGSRSTQPTALVAWRRSRWHGPGSDSVGPDAFTDLDPSPPVLAWLLKPGPHRSANGHPLPPRHVRDAEARFGKEAVADWRERVERLLGVPVADDLTDEPLLLGEAVAGLLEHGVPIAETVGAAARRGAWIRFDAEVAAAHPWHEDDLVYLSRDGDRGTPWIGRVSLWQAARLAKNLKEPFARVADRLAGIARAGGLAMHFDPVRAGAVDEAGADALVLLSRHPSSALPDMDAAELPELTRLYSAVGAGIGFDAEDVLARGWSAEERGVLQRLASLSVFNRWRRRLATEDTLSAGRLAVVLPILCRLWGDPGPKAGAAALAAVQALEEALLLGPLPADVDGGECGERWFFRACDHATRFGIEPARAVACAGRWWCWWLTEEERATIGAPLIPIVAAEAAWWLQVRDLED